MSDALSSKPGLIGTLREVAALFEPDRGLLAFVLLINLVGAALTGIGDPISLKLLIDSLSRNDLRFFLQLTGLMVLVYTSFRGASYVSDLYSQRLRNRLSARLTLRLVGTYYRLPYSRTLEHDRGYFISRVYDEPAKVTNAVALVVDLFSSLAICLCGAGVCLFLSWRVSAIVFLVVPFLVLLSNRYGDRIRRTSLRENEAEARLREGLGRSVASYKNVRLFGLTEHVLQRFGALLESALAITYSRYKQAAAFRTLSGISLSSAETAVMVAAGIQVLQGNLSIGGLFGFVSAYWRVVNSFRNMTTLIPSLSQLSAQLERIHEFEQAAQAQGDPASVPVAPWGVRDLSLGFSDRVVLNRVNLSWQAGERILIVGPNGSGKSTLAHVLTGFLDAPTGELRIPGLARTSALLSPFGFIPGCLRDNLAHGGTSKEALAEVESLARTLGIDDKLEQDPATLSDGEQRRAQVAMALLKDADVYLFDEPLANVDLESKDRIMETIFARTEKRSLIVILHGDDRYRRRFDRVVDLVELGYSASTAPESQIRERTAQ